MLRFLFCLFIHLFFSITLHFIWSTIVWYLHNDSKKNFCQVYSQQLNQLYQREVAEKKFRKVLTAWMQSGNEKRYDFGHFCVVEMIVVETHSTHNLHRVKTELECSCFRCWIHANCFADNKTQFDNGKQCKSRPATWARELLTKEYNPLSISVINW